MFTCGSSFFSTSGTGAGGGASEATITIPAGKVSSTLTSFPVMVRLSDMPSGFWSGVKSDGGDIRAMTVGGTVIPHDLARFDYAAHDGVLFVKITVASGSDTSFKITWGNAGLSRLAVDDANGRNAVWSDYEAVLLFGDTGGDNRTGGASAVLSGGPNLFAQVATSPVITSHQGVCWDGTYYYTVDTNGLYKWDASWTQVATASNPVSNISGTPMANHCGDCDVHGGRLYVPIERYPNSGGLYNAHIAVFSTTDLSFIEAFDISAQGHEASSIAYCPVDGLLYITDYDAHNTTIYKYNPTTGAYVGTLTTDATIGQRQGITFWRNYFWITSDSFGQVYRVTYDGHLNQVVIGSPGATPEGLGHTDDALLMLLLDGPNHTVRTWKSKDIAKAAGGGLTANVDSSGTLIGLPSATTYTLAVTMIVNTKTANRAAVSYALAGTAGANTRQTIAFRSATSNLGIWDVSNSWLESSPSINPSAGQAYRMHAVYQGTTSRKLYVDGVQKNSQSTITAVPSTLNSLFLACEDADLAEKFSGDMGFVYLRTEALSAAWIAAEHANLNSPSTFYTVA